MSNIYLSVIIPVYNESTRIEKGLNGIIQYLRSQSYSSEILLVDDGSTDDTVIQAQQLLKDFPKQQIIKLQLNQGKGAAIKNGIKNSAGKYILFTDIDLSTPIVEVEQLFKSLETHDLAIGVRRHKQAHIIRHQSYLREFLGACFTSITGLIATPGIVDVTCGFKAFRSEAAKKIFSKSLLKAWAFDAEILFLARKFGFSIAQVPVTWTNDTGTKVHMFTDGLQAFIDLLKIRWWDMMGKYD